MRLDSLRSEFNGNKASIDNQLRTLSDKDKAQTQKLSQLEANLGQKASATALNSLTTKVSQVEGRITAEASKYNTLQTTVGQHTASIQQHSQSINGLKAQWTMKVESGGVVAGIGLASSNGKSRFAIRADVLDVVSPDGTKRPMFSVLTRPQTINGVLVQKGSYFDTAFIAHGSINMLHIADSIQSNNYVAGRSGWRLFKNGTIEINSTFGDGTKIQLTSRGLVGFYANGRKAFELGVFTN